MDFKQELGKRTEAIENILTACTPKEEGYQKTIFQAMNYSLFLDSHPKNQKALAYFHEHSERRNEALKEYARRFGPLTIDTANDAASNSWEWIHQQWPWEGGNCSCGTMRSDCNIR